MELDWTLNASQNGNDFFNTKSISQNPIEPVPPIKERAGDIITYIFCKIFGSCSKGQSKSQPSPLDFWRFCGIA